MSNDWNTSFDVQVVADELEQAKEVTDEGEVRFQGWSFKTIEAVLVSAFQWHPELPEAERHGIARGAIVESGRAGRITPDGLKASIRTRQNAYLALHPSRYVLVTSISVRHHSDLRRMRLGNSTLVFEDSLPIHFQRSLADFYEAPEHRRYPRIPIGYTFIRIHVAGRSVSDAAARAFRDIDLVRGIWNLGLNHGKSGRWSSGPVRQPVNRIILGPLHTLHFPNGKMAANVWWYEPDYQIANELFEPTQYSDGMARFQTQVRRSLKHIPFRDRIENAIINYSRALDQRDWNAAFLRLWSVLEDVTFTEKERYDVTIRRAAFIWKEYRYHKQVLLHLRYLRNSFVHENATNEEIETHMYDLKRYVEQLLLFYLRNTRKFSNIGDIIQFLDLSPEQEDLRNRIELYGKGLRFRSGKKI